MFADTFTIWNASSRRAGRPRCRIFRQLLRAAGRQLAEVEGYPNGDFGRLHDPEGDPIGLWEPKKPR